MNTEQLLKKYGWELECESPLEVRHTETNSFATNLAAQIVIAALVVEESGGANEQEKQT